MSLKQTLTITGFIIIILMAFLPKEVRYYIGSFATGWMMIDIVQIIAKRYEK